MTQNLESTESAPVPRSVRRHLGWQTLSEIAGCVGAPGAFIAWKFWSGGVPAGVFDGIVFFGLFIAGYLLPRAVFRHLIAAACPVCAGRMFPQGRNPVLYVCRSCGRSHDTGMSEGEDGQATHATGRKAKGAKNDRSD